MIFYLMIKFMRYRKIKFFYIFSRIILVLIFLFFLSLLARLGAGFVEKKLLVKIRPGSNLERPESLSSEFIVNSNPGTSIFSDRIVEEIDNAKFSLEIAMYSFSSESLKKAVYAASERGVKVVLITDFRQDQKDGIFFADAPSNIIFIKSGSESDGRTSLMHHKFALIDRGQKNQKLIFGSYNWTDLQEKYDPSFVMISSDKDLIFSFGREFNRLHAGGGLQKIHNNYYPWDLSLSANGNNYEVWFGPGRSGESVKSRISSLIEEAENDIKIMIWDFTDQDLAVALVRRARAGLRIRLITDTWNFANKNSVFIYLVQAKKRYHLDNLEIILDETNGDYIRNIGNASELNEDFDPFLHLHVLIIDDKKVLFGTNNWSRAGFFYNDESIMVSNDQVALDFFCRIFAEQYERNRSASITN